jgi:hypothetical protein
MGKGDTRRPTRISDGEFTANWLRAFGESDMPEWRKREMLEPSPLPLVQTCDDDWPDHPDYPQEDE